MTDVKIRCDDCKFVENCVDYGWQECRKFTPKPSEQMTNEEWFCSLPTEKKAKVLACEFVVACDDYAYSNNKETWNEKYWVEWLKQPHK